MATNKQRAKWAEAGLEAFTDETNQRLDLDGYPEVIEDFLCDLMHLCDREQVPFYAAVEAARVHYREEVAEEETDYETQSEEI